MNIRLRKLEWKYDNQIIFDNNHLFLLHEADDMNYIEKALLLQQVAEMKQKLFPIQIFEGKR